MQTKTGVGLMLPKGVRLQHGRYYLARRQGARTQWIGLTRATEGRAALERALAKVQSELPAVPKTVDDLLRCFLADPTIEIREITRREYARMARSRLKAVFGHMPIGAVTSAHVARYLEAGRRAGRSTMANRERACLSSAFEWAMRNGYADVNPCRGVRRNKERPSKRELTDQQFLDAYRRAPTYVRNLMYVAYLTGLRQVDLMELRKDWLREDGIALDESKTGHRRTILWTDHLRLAIERCLAYSPERSPYVLVSARGAKWTSSGMQSAIKRYRFGFAFRLIRPKAATDGDAQGVNVLGHRGQMLTRYVRRERLKPVA